MDSIRGRTGRVSALREVAAHVCLRASPRFPCQEEKSLLFESETAGVSSGVSVCILPKNISGSLIVDVSALPNFMPPGPGNLKEKIYAQVGPDLVRIEEEIRRLLDSDIPLISVVGRYIMDSGGKRLRPLLMILSSRLCGYSGGNDISLAVVFEFLHAAALLHDDVVDHAEFRRSHPAANTIWGNPGVVLVGDFLYSKAIQLAVG